MWENRKTKGWKCLPTLLCALSLVAVNGSTSWATFIGDLVFCDQDANGVFDSPGDFGLNGVSVQVTCTDPTGVTCANITTMTGTIDQSVIDGGVNFLPQRCSADRSSAPLTWTCPNLQAGSTLDLPTLGRNPSGDLLC